MTRKAKKELKKEIKSSIHQRINFRSWYKPENSDAWYFRLMRPVYHLNSSRFPKDIPCHGIGYRDEDTGFAHWFGNRHLSLK